MINSIQTLVKLVTVLCCLFLNVSSAPTTPHPVPRYFYSKLPHCRVLPKIQPLLNDLGIIPNYLVDEALGCGGVGVVVLAMNMKSKERAAIKIAPIEEGDKKLSSRYFGHFRESITKAGLFAIVIDLVPGVDLYHFLDHNKNVVTEAVIHKIFRLKELKRAGLCHKNIKPPNIMIYKGAEGFPAAKFVDFGFLTEFSETRPISVTGTLQFRAAELMPDLPYKNCCATDTFATGATLFYSMFSEFSFLSKDAIIHGELTKVHQSPQLSGEARHHIFEMLNRDANKRITIDEILQHSWTRRVSTRADMKAAFARLVYK